MVSIASLLINVLTVFKEPYPEYVMMITAQCQVIYYSSFQMPDLDDVQRQRNR